MIGYGVTGIVWECLHKETGEARAVKIIEKNKAGPMTEE